MPVGATVRIVTGPLTGMVGKVIRRAKRDQFVAVVHFLGRGATVDLAGLAGRTGRRIRRRRLILERTSRRSHAPARSPVRRRCRLRVSRIPVASATCAPTPGQCRDHRRASRVGSASGLGVAARLLQPLRRIVAISGHALVVLARPIAHVAHFSAFMPKCAAHAAGSSGSVIACALLEDLPPIQLAEDRAGQGDVAAQCRMVRILDHMVADQSVRADRSQLAASVDQDAAGVPRARPARRAARKGPGSGSAVRRCRARPGNECAASVVPALLPAAGPAGNGPRRNPGAARGSPRIVPRLAAGSCDSRARASRNSSANRRRSLPETRTEGASTGWARTPAHWPAGRSRSARRRSGRNTRRSPRAAG